MVIIIIIIIVIIIIIIIVIVIIIIIIIIIIIKQFFGIWSYLLPVRVIFSWHDQMLYSHNLFNWIFYQSTAVNTTVLILYSFFLLGLSKTTDPLQGNHSEVQFDSSYLFHF